MEPGEPAGHDGEPRPDDAVDAAAAAPLLREEARGLEHVEVARGRRPGVAEACRDVSGRDTAPAEVDRHQDLPPGRVRERGEDRLRRLEAVLRATSPQTGGPCARPARAAS